jgi:hypothetical protein
MQGMVMNYTHFVSELSRSTYAMMSQSQATSCNRLKRPRTT